MTTVNSGKDQNERPKSAKPTLDETNINGIRQALVYGDFSKVKQNERYIDIREHIYDVNRVGTKMAVYEPLHDDSLTDYFSQPSVKKHLAKIGFIDPDGKIVSQKEFHNHHVKLEAIRRADQALKDFTDADANMKIDSAIRREVEKILADPSLKKRRPRSAVVGGIDINKLPISMRHTAEIYLTSNSSRPSTAGQKHGGKKQPAITREPYTTKSALLRQDFIRKRMEELRVLALLEQQKCAMFGTCDVEGVETVPAAVAAAAAMRPKTAGFRVQPDALLSTAAYNPRPTAARTQKSDYASKAPAAAVKQASAPVAVVATSPAFSSQPSSTESTQKKEKTGIFGKLKSKLGVGKTAEEEFERPLSAGDYQRPHTAASGSKASSKSTSKTAESKYDQDVFEDVPFESDNEEAVKVTVIQPASPKTNSKASKKQAKTAVSNLAKSHVAGDNASSSSLVINKGAVNPKIELTAPQSESQADAKAGAIPEPSSLAVVGKTDSKRGSGLLGGLFRRSKSSSQQSINKAASSQNLQKKEAEDAKNQETANAVMQAIFSAPVSATSATPSVAASVTPTSAATTDSQNQLNGGRKHVTFGGSSEDKLADAAYIASTSSESIRGSKSILRNGKGAEQAPAVNTNAAAENGREQSVIGA